MMMFLLLIVLQYITIILNQTFVACSFFLYHSNQTNLADSQCYVCLTC